MFSVKNLRKRPLVLENCPEHIRIPSTASNSGSEYTVTEVATYAFLNLSTSKSIFIPKTIRKINYNAMNSLAVDSIVFEQGSQLKEIETFGIGWIHATHFTLPPSVEKLVEDSLRGFQLVRHLYYCGTFDFSTINVFGSSNDISMKVHVSPYYPSSKFGNIQVNKQLRCEFPLLLPTVSRKNYHIYYCIIISFLTRS